ncbi:MAG TPA: hypothetical protein VJR27_03575 [Candidatus Saccharimonadales bacterium]|nr:hypothetical protein [Candidatus Saccharimonadales bacterium]
MTHEIDDALPVTSSVELAEANASHAVGRYLVNGPSKPYDQLPARGLEGIRGQLDNYPTGNTQEVSGWVAVEQAFVIGGNPDLRKAYSIDACFEAAEDAFTNALDLHDPAEDDTMHLWRVELAMAALPLYMRWAKDESPETKEVRVFHEDVTEVGHKIMALKEANEASWSEKTQHEYEGFASELVTMLAYNRRQKDGSDSNPSFAVPSTYRQNLSQLPGSVGNERDRTRMRGNWDISVVSHGAGSLALTDKLQVKKMLYVPLHGEDEARKKRDYTEDITVVTVRDHICRSILKNAPWDPLENLLATTEPGVANKLKVVSSALSRNLYERIDVAATLRSGKDGSTLHEYIRNPRPNRQRRPF